MIFEKRQFRLANSTVVQRVPQIVNLAKSKVRPHLRLTIVSNVFSVSIYFQVRFHQEE